MRVYLPATMGALARLRDQGQLEAPHGQAVTAALRELSGETDPEELAYAAYREAAEQSLRLLRDAPAPPRRVVIAVDVPAEPDPARGGGAVSVRGPVPRQAVAAIHVDGAGAAAAVAAAVAALPAADAGDERAAEAVAEVADHELEWFDSSELDRLIG